MDILGLLFVVLFLVAGLVAATIFNKKRVEAQKNLEGIEDPVPNTSSRNFDSYAYKESLEETKRARNRHAATVKLNRIISFSSLGAAAIALIILISSCFTIVSAKNIGVAVNFGAVSQQTLSPGLNFKAPWTKVIEIDGTMQPDKYGDDSDQSCIKVRIGDGSEACATIVNRWSVNPKNAAKVYSDYRSNDPTQYFKEAIVSNDLAQAVQAALKTYNPIAELKAVASNDTSANLSFTPDYNKLSKVIEEDMKKRMSVHDLAVVEGVTFSYLSISPNTQKKLDDYIAEVGETRIATQKKETAKAQAEANRELSSSVSKDPNVLVSRCLDILNESTQKNYQLPAGFSCWPGGGSTMIVPKESNNQQN